MMQAVQVIIERLKTNPEDFFGELEFNAYDPPRTPRFEDIAQKIDDLLLEKNDVGNIHRLWFLEPEEKAALIAAYKDARRARFEAKLFHTLLRPNEPPQYNIAMDRMSSQGKRLMQGVGSAILAPQRLEK